MSADGTSHGARQRREERRQLTAAALAISALILIAAFVFLIEGQIGRSGYTIRGIFASANGLEPGNPVRTAGVEVGQVSGISKGPANTALVTMSIQNAGRPVRVDSTLGIKPRLLLEGNFYIDLEPGTPGAPQLPSGGTIPEGHTSVPVQFDQFLDTFSLPTRNALQATFKGFAGGLGSGDKKGTAPPGYAGLRDAVRALSDQLPAMGAAAQVSQGTAPDDLHHMITSMRDFTSQFVTSPQSLAGLTTHFNRFMGDLAAEDQPLAQTMVDLDAMLQTAPPTLRALDASMPVLGHFGQELDPVLRGSPLPLRESTRLLDQFGALSSPNELPAMLTQLHPVTANLPPLEARLIPLAGLLTRADACLSGHAVWTLDQKLQDGSNSSGDTVWRDILHALTGTTSVTGGFDGNGSATRVGVVASPNELQGIIPGLGAVAGIGPTIEGVRPTWLGYGVEPPYRPDKWCDQQPLPNLHARSGPPPAWANAVVRRPVVNQGSTR